MKFRLTAIILLIVSSIVAQEKLSSRDVYSDNDIVYSKSNLFPLTGVVAFIKSNNHIVFEKEYKEGFLKKYTEYFNGKEKRIAEEIYYYPKTNRKQKRIKFDLNAKLFWVTTYDESGNKRLYQILENDTVTYSCEYLNGKKHGEEMCADKKGKAIEQHYLNGKLIP
jgi:antitoxin component YwqK of YwqJK toxin-antitoxin module